MSDFNTIEEALADIRKGKMVIVIDDEDRENEGDFVMAAEMSTPEAINFMSIHGRGIICTPILEERAKELKLDLMVNNNKSLFETAFTVSVDSIKGGTGISAKDRDLTIKTLINTEASPADLMRPGHIFPLIAKEEGVLRRAGHTEASVDLARLAGLYPAGIICEIMDEDGSMARTPSLIKLAKKLDLKLITIKSLIKYRTEKESLITKAGKISFPNMYGDFELHLFLSSLNPEEHHIALVKGEIVEEEPVLVRVHSECFTGDIFGSKRCDCGEQLELAMRMIEKEGKGILVYMRQEGRGIGLVNKIKAYMLQDKGDDTVTANQKLGFKPDLREYGIGAQILKALNVKEMKLLTNNPKKIVGLEGFGLKIVERVPLEIEPNEMNIDYLKTKKSKLGHLFKHI